MKKRPLSEPTLVSINDKIQERELAKSILLAQKRRKENQDLTYFWGHDTNLREWFNRTLSSKMKPEDEISRIANIFQCSENLFSSFVENFELQSFKKTLISNYHRKFVIVPINTTLLSRSPQDLMNYHQCNPELEHYEEYFNNIKSARSFLNFWSHFKLGSKNMQNLIGDSENKITFKKNSNEFSINRFGKKTFHKIPSKIFLTKDGEETDIFNKIISSVFTVENIDKNGNITKDTIFDKLISGKSDYDSKDKYSVDSLQIQIASEFKVEGWIHFIMVRAEVIENGTGRKNIIKKTFMKCSTKSFLFLYQYPIACHEGFEDKFSEFSKFANKEEKIEEEKEEEELAMIIYNQAVKLIENSSFQDEDEDEESECEDYEKVSPILPIVEL